MKNNFNKNHPERLEDEVFITNADDETNPLDLEDTRSSYQCVGWETKRRGIVSYDIDGVPLGNRWSGSFPVFAKQNEIRKSGNGEQILKRLLP